MQEATVITGARSDFGRSSGGRVPQRRPWPVERRTRGGSPPARPQVRPAGVPWLLDLGLDSSVQLSYEFAGAGTVPRWVGCPHLLRSGSEPW